jgi:diazepam-binding inhibitor (GABA receptor modulating acyl-CoA-binding protein)
MAQEESIQREDFEVDFDKAARFVRKNESLLSQEQKLKLYALYKQSKIGNCNTNRPSGMFNWERKAMWDEWNSLKEKNIKNPKQMYVDYLTSQVKDWEEL